MMRLIYERPAQIKVQIIRIIIEHGEEIHKESLTKLLNISTATLEKYLCELQVELPQGTISFSRFYVNFNREYCSLYDVQRFYLSKSITKDILHYCFFSSTSYSLEKLAQKLYISSSKLFNVLKYLEQPFNDIDIAIIRAPEVSLIGKAEAIMIVYNLLLHIEDQPFQTAFTQIDESCLKEEIIKFFKSNDIRIEHNVIRDFSLWLLTVNDKKFLTKNFSTTLGADFPCNFLNFDKLLIQSLRPLLSFFFVHEDLFYNDTITLIMVFILFNYAGVHFKTEQKEKEFFTKKVTANYLYPKFLFSLLSKEVYQINTCDLNWFSLKIEGSIHYFDLLYPYFYLYGEFFNPQWKRSPRFNILIAQIEEELMQESNLRKFLNTKVSEFLVHSLSLFQKNYFKETMYRIGISSIKGTFYEKQLCDDLKKSIEILPYYEFDNTKKSIDLLIVDDLRQINKSHFKNYLLLTDDYANLKADEKNG